MTYLKRSNVSEKRTKKRTLGIISVLVLVFCIHFFFPKVYPTILYPFTSFFWKSETSVLGWFGSMGEMVMSKYSLVKENKKLREEIASRDGSMLLLDTLRKENESLKNDLNRSGKGDLVLGVILSRPPISPYDTLVIDVGATDDVSLGDKVYGLGDTLIGDIVEVYEHQSKVSLFSTPGRETPVLVGSSTIATNAMGRGGGNFSVKLPADIKIQKGDSILTTQIRPHVFGSVQEIVVDSSDSLQTILFRAPLNINEFRFVEVDKASK